MNLHELISYLLTIPFLGLTISMIGTIWADDQENWIKSSFTCLIVFFAMFALYIVTSPLL